MEKDFLISFLTFHFLTKDKIDKFSYNQYFEFTDILRRRWYNKFKKDFLSNAVSYFGVKDDCSVLSVLKTDFDACFDCFCREFCND